MRVRGPANVSLAGHFAAGAAPYSGAATPTPRAAADYPRPAVDVASGVVRSDRRRDGAAIRARGNNFNANTAADPRKN